MDVDERRLGELVERFADDVAAATRAATVVAGDRLGLYRALAYLGPSDATDLAPFAGGDVHFVQEWLDAQCAAGYCHFSALTHRYWLSPEQEAVLADTASPTFMVPAMTLAHLRFTHQTIKETAMPGVEYNDFSQPDEVRSPDKTTVEIVKIGGGEIGRYTFQPGWRWSECIKPVAGTDSCQVEHVGYCLSGAIHVKHDDGTEADVKAGDVYRIAPGHDAWVDGPQPMVTVEFQGAAGYAK